MYWRKQSLVQLAAICTSDKNQSACSNLLQALKESSPAVAFPGEQELFWTLQTRAFAFAAAHSHLHNN